MIRRAFEKLRTLDAAYVAMYLMFGTMLAKAGRVDDGRAWLRDGITAAGAKGDSHALSELQDEIEAIRGLDAYREPLLRRTAPLVIFLLRRGSGLQELAGRRGLSALLHEQEVDPDEIDRASTEMERSRFCAELQQTPEE